MHVLSGGWERRSSLFRYSRRMSLGLKISPVPKPRSERARALVQGLILISPPEKNGWLDSALMDGRDSGSDDPNISGTKQISYLSIMPFRLFRTGCGSRGAVYVSFSPLHGQRCNSLCPRVSVSGHGRRLFTRAFTTGIRSVVRVKMRVCRTQDQRRTGPRMMSWHIFFGGICCVDERVCDNHIRIRKYPEKGIKVHVMCCKRQMTRAVHNFYMMVTRRDHGFTALVSFLVLASFL